MFLELCGDGVPKVSVGVDAVYEVYKGWIEAVNLVAWSRAEFEDLALSSADKGGDNSGIFVRDKPVGSA